MSSNPPQQDLSGLAKSIESLENLYVRVSDEKFIFAQDDVIRLGLYAGLIKNLEFTYEQSWKSMKRWLENNVSPAIADGIPRRELFRLARENLLIQDVEEWMVYHEARNRASHEYDSAIIEHVLNVIGDFIRASQELLKELQKRQ